MNQRREPFLPKTALNSEASAGKAVLQVLAGQKRWPPPIWLMRQAGRYLPEYRQVRASVPDFLTLCLTPELATEITLQPIRRYDFDAAILFADILLVPWALGQPLAFVEGEGPKLDAITDAAGVAALSQGDVDHSLARLSPVSETVDRLKGLLPDHTTLIGFAGGPWTVACYMVEGGGSKDFGAVKRFAYADPQAFAALVDLVTETTIHYLLAQIRAGAEVVQIFESWAGILPEPAFDRWVIEPTTRIVTALHCEAPAVPVIGFPRAAGLLAERFVAETGIDAVGLDSAMPLDWVVERLQTRIPVQGNLDPAILLAGGSALRDETARLLDCLSHGAHIFNLGHGVMQATPPAHVTDLVDQVRNSIAMSTGGKTA